MRLSIAKISFCNSRISFTSSRSAVLLIIFLIFVSVLSGSIFAHTNNLRFGQLRKRRTKILLVEGTVEEQGSVNYCNKQRHHLNDENPAVSHERLSPIVIRSEVRKHALVPLQAEGSAPSNKSRRGKSQAMPRHDHPWKQLRISLRKTRFAKDSCSFICEGEELFAESTTNGMLEG